MFAIDYLKNMAAAFLTDKNSNKRRITENEACNSSRFQNGNCKESGLKSNKTKRNGNIKKIKKRDKKKKKKKYATAKKLLKHQFYSAMNDGGSVETTSLFKEKLSLSTTTGTNLKKAPLVIIEKTMQIDYSRVRIALKLE